MARKPKEASESAPRAKWPNGDPATMTLAEILYEVQQRITVPKDKENKYGGFMYRTVEQINRAIKGILADYPGTVLRYHDEITSMGGWRYVHSTCSLERGDERISEDGYARESEHKSKFDDAQLTGSASSYARKYAAQALFAIDGEPDADEQGANRQAMPTPAQQPQRRQPAQGQPMPAPQGQGQPRPARQVQRGPAPMPTYQRGPNDRGQYDPAPWE